MIISRSDLDSLLHARHPEPHSLLGMHWAENAARAAGENGKSKKMPKSKASFGAGKKSAGGGEGRLVARAFLRGAVECALIDPESGERWPMSRLDDAGVFEVAIPRRRKHFRYELEATDGLGREWRQHDPYAFLPTLGAADLHLFNEGNDHRIYDKLGAHLRTHEGAAGGGAGVSFAVWAPNASQVSLVGDFNGWDGRYHPMRTLGQSGVWELFVPGLGEGALYKFQIRDQAGHTRLKTDPYGQYFEAPPGNASIVWDTRKHEWGDAAWMKSRSRCDSPQPAAAPAAGRSALERPISIYEVHLGSWRRDPGQPERLLSYRELAPQLADYAVEMGFTHVEIMPIAEHPFDGSWGYQVTGFYAPSQRYGTPEDFAWFVDHLHQRGVGVILDWVPAHFPRDAFALAEFDGTALYEHADPRKGAHMDWGTLIFNYGRNEVRGFLAANALFWLERYHIDGLRVDAVASMLYLDYSREPGQWIPNEYGGRENLEAIAFLKHTNGLVKHYYPQALTIAEESTSFPGITRALADGGLGFDLKWNMGWMHDTLRYFAKEPVHRKWHHGDLTFGMLYQYSENFITVFSHDEVVHGKGSMLFKMGAAHIPEKAANLRALYTHMWAWPGKKLLFMGCEFGQSQEWDFRKSLDWHLCQYGDHEGLRRLVRDLNHLYLSEPALGGASDLHPQSFQWLAAYDTQASVIAYLRRATGGAGDGAAAAPPAENASSPLAVVVHLTPVIRQNYRVGVPLAGLWREVLNSNSSHYGGTGLGNDGARHTEPIPADGHPQSLSLTLPPLTTTLFKWAGT
ncbi:glycogen-branching enzyme [Cephaloticoccus primus]|uniref:1,4-alpha-glucan branching enzyme GlgB n=1 Tax=Cephaloticoccus primus TaxID=1548207 RepID=A0A139SRP8_9BACT|nr:1,4-alpha-glucan branching protein GlgB [Cephaloticoccus primus]KXU37184.1 glycogen-branching enzyme [Cephaloticoccus primus]